MNSEQVAYLATMLPLTAQAVMNLAIAPAYLKDNRPARHSGGNMGKQFMNIIKLKRPLPCDLLPL
ncbi:MAG: hypothetical protein LBS03_09275 [Bacteroidales bacterium]|nr:hypothetical protein [Bacteroidales bacterium]